MDKFKIVLLYFFFGLSYFFVHGQQIGNYVSNGSFEELTYPYGNYNSVKYWSPIDTNNFCYYVWTTSPTFSITMAPYIPTGFQYPRTGSNLILTSFYCDVSTCTYTNSRGYPRNRLKKPLKPNTAYCAKYYVVNTNNCSVATDSFGAYFGSALIDTITNCTAPLTFLNPQIQNAPGNIITDTLNWIAIGGTFVATGNEKYMVIGNFKSNSNTYTVILNPTYLPQLGTDIYIDDVSLIEVNLPAYAGPDKLIYPGDSVYIGRESDFAIDPGCIWYKLPNMTTALDTISGLWVKPSVTSTYVVRQELDCSSVKWDTVVVTINHNLVDLDKIQSISDNISLFPNPTSGNLNVSFSGSLPTDITSYSIIDNLGQIIREEEIDLKKSSFIVSTSDLVNGLYQIHFKTSFGSVTKKFVKLN